MRRSICAIVALALAMAPAAFGQAQRGSVTVTVMAADGSVLPGATVSAESDQTLTRRTAITDAAGRATLVGLDPAANYVVTTSMDGFNGARNENVRVRAGLDIPIQVTLAELSVTEELTVTAESPVVDISSAVTGQDITLQLTESLPTARSYQDYLQLVPGVMPATDQGPGANNPASRSGLNYRDLLGEVGVSRDNFYYLEGINVTDTVQGYTRTNLNTEIIQEQSVLTGGLPAEFVGAPGLVSNVLTKSGGNQFTGSANYYFQNDSLVDKNKHFEDTDFDTTDAAVTFGGPIVRDQAWFFLSFRNVNRKDKFTDVSGDSRDSEQDTDQGFAKLTWVPTNKDLLSGVFLSDPLDVSGQNDPQILRTRNTGEKLGAERYMFNYSHVFSVASLDVGYNKHEGDLDLVSEIQAPGNTVTFRVGDPFTPQVDEDLGGNGNNNFETRGTEGFRGSVEFFFDTSWGDHSLKVGGELAEYTDFRDQNYVVGAGGQTNDWVSLDLRYLGQGVSNADIINNFTETNFDARNPSDYGGFLDTFALLSAGDQAAILAAYDRGCANPNTGEQCIAGDGVLSPSELAENMTYNSTAGNPNGMINYGRREQITSGASELSSEGTIWYVQDTWQWKKWSVNAGVRAEEWEHFATTGENLFTFDWEYAPRVSVAYDLRGDGRQRISLYYGRYYDPIRNNATQFVGSLTNRVLEEQVYVDAIQDWVSFRTRGGLSQLDATFAPTTKTPYTDEYQLGYKQDLGRNMSIEANYIMRETRDIIEDYDYGLYALSGCDGCYPGPVDDPNSLFLGEGFFGFSGTPTSNFNIGTLPPGNFRDWDGLELIFRKRYSDNWQAIASYSYADAKGNTSSDSNFDFAGDVLWLDPRAPNMENTQPGLVEHLFKVAGSYNFDMGIQVGAQYRWNSGAIVNKTFRAFRRHLPAQVDQSFDFAGITDNWVRPDAVGQNTNNPSYGIFDVRVAYLWNITGRFQADFFLDIFNVLDEQKATQTEDQIGLPTFGDGVRFVPPRRYFLGARLRF